MQFDQNKPFDVLCVGRAGVDFYAQEKETDFQDVGLFYKSIGGSSANVATQLARLEKKTAMLTTLSEDMLGRYVHHFLTQETISDDFIQWDNTGTRTSLAITETKKNDCQVVIYRNQAADLELDEKKINFEMVKKYKALFITGTTLSAAPSRETVLTLIEFAKNNQIKIIFDLDYRQYSWQNEAETAHWYHLAAQSSDVIIGNTEEWAIFKHLDDADNATIFDRYLSDRTSIIILKQGSQGSETITKKERFFVKPFAVKSIKPFGAGDAFAGAFISSILEEYDLEQAVVVGSAAAALVVQKVGCAEAMPKLKDITSFIHQHNS